MCFLVLSHLLDLLSHFRFLSVMYLSTINACAHVHIPVPTCLSLSYVLIHQGNTTTGLSWCVHAGEVRIRILGGKGWWSGRRRVEGKVQKKKGQREKGEGVESKSMMYMVEVPSKH